MDMRLQEARPAVPGLVGTALGALLAGATLRWAKKEHRPRLASRRSQPSDSDLLNERVRAAVEWRRSRAPDAAVSDDVLIERVRAQLSRPYLSRPGLVDVRVSRGQVWITGRILAREADDLVSRMGCVEGARSVDCQLRLC